jgi:hypothetical protein
MSNFFRLGFSFKTWNNVNRALLWERGGKTKELAGVCKSSSTGRGKKSTISIFNIWVLLNLSAFFCLGFQTSAVQLIFYRGDWFSRHSYTLFLYLTSSITKIISVFFAWAFKQVPGGSFILYTKLISQDKDVYHPQILALFYDCFKVMPKEQGVRASPTCSYVTLDCKIYCKKLKMCWFSSGNWFFHT